MESKLFYRSIFNNKTFKNLNIIRNMIFSQYNMSTELGFLEENIRLEIQEAYKDKEIVPEYINNIFRHTKNERDKVLNEAQVNINKLLQDDKEYQDFLNEKLFTDIYQYFEWYINSLCKSIYDTKSNNLSEFDYKKYNKEIGKYLFDKVGYICIYTGLNICEYKEGIIKFNCIRNVIIHNQGYIDKQFIDTMKRFEIKHKYKNNENISKFVGNNIEEFKKLNDKFDLDIYKYIENKIDKQGVKK